MIEPTLGPLDCRAPHPLHRSGVCELLPGDSIHRPRWECRGWEGEDCPNPDAHHSWVGPADTWRRMPEGTDHSWDGT